MKAYLWSLLTNPACGWLKGFVTLETAGSFLRALYASVIAF